MIKKPQRTRIKQMLKTKVVEFDYKKLDGEKRHLIGTLDPTYLPRKKTTTSAKPRTRTDEVLVVWDLQRKGWRSMVWDHINSVKFIDKKIV